MKRAIRQAKEGRVPITRVSKVSERRWSQLVKEHPFVLSPHGHGLDCHRTWQVLLLGSFPIVASSSLDSVYDGLPVVIVSRWEDLSTVSVLFQSLLWAVLTEMYLCHACSCQEIVKKY